VPAVNFVVFFVALYGLPSSWSRAILLGLAFFAVVGFFLSLRALVASGNEIHDMRSGIRDRDKWDSAVIGCVLGALGMAMNGLGGVAFLIFSLIPS